MPRLTNASGHLDGAGQCEAVRATEVSMTISALLILDRFLALFINSMIGADPPIEALKFKERPATVELCSRSIKLRPMRLQSAETMFLPSLIAVSIEMDEKAV